MRTCRAVFRGGRTILHSLGCPLLCVICGLEASSQGLTQRLAFLPSPPQPRIPTLGVALCGCPVLLDLLGRREGGGPPGWKVPWQRKHCALHLCGQAQAPRVGLLGRAAVWDVMSHPRLERLPPAGVLSPGLYQHQPASKPKVNEKSKRSSPPGPSLGW